MPWIKFKVPFDYRPKPRVMISYKVRHSYLVKQDCADQAIAAGKAEYTERPKEQKNECR